MNGIFIIAELDGPVAERVKAWQEQFDIKLAREAPPHVTMLGSSGVGPIAPDTPVDALQRLLGGSTSVLVGQSGTGKSSLLNALLGDAIARVAILLWTATALSLAVPVLPAAWMQTLSTYLLDIPALTVAIAAVAKGLPKIADESERRFWRLLGMGCVAWLAVSLPYAALAPGGHWSLGWKVYGDLVYVVGYLGLILAIEVQPHRLQIHQHHSNH